MKEEANTIRKIIKYYGVRFGAKDITKEVLKTEFKIDFLQEMKLLPVQRSPTRHSLDGASTHFGVQQSSSKTLKKTRNFEQDATILFLLFTNEDDEQAEDDWFRALSLSAQSEKKVNLNFKVDPKRDSDFKFLVKKREPNETLAMRRAQDLDGDSSNVDGCQSLDKEQVMDDEGHDQEKLDDEEEISLE
ncbi:hypothetical protein R1flu_026649 [Riccia fluitans]|uniref:PH domain-containing protein n=1 Tax=Riccia fluitans TaxID=41844 RepID=A0ABD1XGK1_9MARC